MPHLFSINMISIIDQVLDQLARTGGPQDLGIVLLFENDGPVVYHNSVSLSLVMHVGVVTGPVNVEEESVVGHLAGLHVLVGPVVFNPVELRACLGAGN